VYRHVPREELDDRDVFARRRTNPFCARIRCLKHRFRRPLGELRVPPRTVLLRRAGMEAAENIHAE